MLYVRSAIARRQWWQEQDGFEAGSSAPRMNLRQALPGSSDLPVTAINDSHAVSSARATKLPTTALAKLPSGSPAAAAASRIRASSTRSSRDASVSKMLG